MTPSTDRETVAALLETVETMRAAAQTIDRLQIELMAALLEVAE
jgi:hypothetical protein